MAVLNFLEQYQSATRRDYVQRVVEHDKAESAAVAKQWGRDYWDGDRRYGYGGYRYDGRWLPIARNIAKHYGLKAGDRVLEIGCGKAFLLHEFAKAVPGIEPAGLDISEYALAQAPAGIQGHLVLGSACELPWPDRHFDFVYSINTFHNLRIPDLKRAVKEMQRVSKEKAWLCVESYRDEREKANLLYWQLTCMSFHDTEEWLWLLKQWGYGGDVGFIFFQ